MAAPDQVTADLYRTLIVETPVYYGSPAGSICFIAFIAIHGLAGFVSLITSFLAMCSVKGSAIHIKSGKIYCIAMAAIAVTGTIGEITRMTSYTAENHCVYSGFADPSSYSIRISFIYVGFGIMSSIIQATYGKNTRNIEKCTASFYLLFMFPIFNICLFFVIQILSIVMYPFWDGFVLNLTYLFINTSNAYFWYTILYRKPADDSIANTTIPKLERVLLHSWNMSFLTVTTWCISMVNFIPGLLIKFDRASFRDPDRHQYRGDEPVHTLSIEVLLVHVVFVFSFGGLLPLAMYYYTKRKLVAKYQSGTTAKQVEMTVNAE